MTNTITASDLNALLKRINQSAGFEAPKWSEVGSYDLSWAYGGVKLVQYVSAGGGEKDITHGFDTKRVTYGKMLAYLAGFETSKVMTEAQRVYNEGRA